MRLPNLFAPPLTGSFETIQRARFLHVMLWAIGIAGVAIGLVNFADQAYLLAYSLFVLAALCVAGLYLNHKGRRGLTGALVSAMVLFVMGYNLYDGAALHDPGVAAYPIFILFTSFLFGKRAVLWSSLASVASFAGIYYLGTSGLVEFAREPTLNRLVILTILVVVAAFLVWVVTDNWEKAIDELRIAYDSTLQGWAKALEFRDHETEGHSRRVTELSTTLAERLGCNAEEIEHIRRGAYLHDIGKIAIPDEILFKPARLRRRNGKSCVSTPSWRA